MTKKKGNGKQTKSYEEERELKQQKTVKVFAWGLLIIMGLTLISWSMIGNPASQGGESGQNLPFTQNIFQNSETGDTYDGAIIDGIQFIFFEDVTQYADNSEMIDLSNQLKKIDVNNSIIHIRTDKYTKAVHKFIDRYQTDCKVITDIRGAVFEETLYYKNFNFLINHLKF